MSAADQAIIKGHSRIKEIASCLSLKSATIDKAYELYKKIMDMGSLKGRSEDARVATVIFIATRMTDCHKPIEKILAFSECTKKEISKCYNKVKFLFPQYQTRLFASKVAEHACNTLELPTDLVNASKITSDNLSSLQVIEGKKPQTVAGAAIHLVLQHSRELKNGRQITLDEIAATVEIKPSTIVETCKLVNSFV